MPARPTSNSSNNGSNNECLRSPKNAQKSEGTAITSVRRFPPYPPLFSASGLPKTSKEPLQNPLAALWLLDLWGVGGERQPLHVLKEIRNGFEGLFKLLPSCRASVTVGDCGLFGPNTNSMQAWRRLLQRDYRSQTGPRS
jgi:hypothetical protein